MLCNFTETNLQNYFKQPNKKNRFIFQNIFILEFYFLKIRIFFRLNRKTLIIILPIQQEEDYFIHLLKDCYLPKCILPNNSFTL